MASSAYKPVVDRFIAPVARGLLSMGVTPNAITVIGALGSTISAAYFYSNGRFVIGTLLVAFFTVSDLFDGAMARASNQGASKWGGFIDSTCDRITDAAIMGGLIIHFIRTDSRLTNVTVIALVLGMLIPYIRAKAESFGLECAVGIAERTERLILVISGIALDGLGVPYVLAAAILLLVFLSFITVLQRIHLIYKGLSRE